MSETKSDVLLEVKNLHKAFDKHVVLNDVNTTVRKGDVMPSSDLPAAVNPHFYVR